MRYLYILSFLCISYNFCIAQVGINTTNPIGSLHIDILGNTINPSIKSQLKDDLIIAPDKNGIISIAIGGEILNNASIALHSPDKAFLMNRVNLKAADDITTVNNPQNSMTVYNTNSDGTLETGIYYFYNGKWIMLQTAFQSNKSATKYLEESITTGITTDGKDMSSASILNFGEIKIQQTGSYAFSLNLNGETITINQAPFNYSFQIARGIYYIYLLKQSSGQTDWTLVDVAEIVNPVYKGDLQSTYTIQLCYTATGGDIVLLKMAYLQNSDAKWKLNANTTSVTYWKL